MNQAFARVMVLVTVILMDILGGTEVDLFVPSFPEIKSHFNVSTVLLEALLSVNFLGFCLSLFFVGGLADRYGRKPIILLGLVIFIIGSGLCSIASSYNILLMGRFCQGFGVAASATLCFLIIADTYPIAKQQYFMGVLNGLMNVAPLPPAHNVADLVTPPTKPSFSGSVTKHDDTHGSIALAGAAIGMAAKWVMRTGKSEQANHDKKDGTGHGF